MGAKASHLYFQDTVASLTLLPSRFFPRQVYHDWFFLAALLHGWSSWGARKSKTRPSTRISGRFSYNESTCREAIIGPYNMWLQQRCNEVRAGRMAVCC